MQMTKTYRMTEILSLDSVLYKMAEILAHVSVLDKMTWLEFTQMTDSFVQKWLTDAGTTIKKSY
jgi:hypothetical protein